MCVSYQLKKYVVNEITDIIANLFLLCSQPHTHYHHISSLMDSTNGLLCDLDSMDNNCTEKDSNLCAFTACRQNRFSTRYTARYNHAETFFCWAIFFHFSMKSYHNGMLFIQYTLALYGG